MMTISIRNPQAITARLAFNRREPSPDFRMIHSIVPAAMADERKNLVGFNQIGSPARIRASMGTSRAVITAPERASNVYPARMGDDGETGSREP
jgi:hypothetical protein